MTAQILPYIPRVPIPFEFNQFTEGDDAQKFSVEPDKDYVLFHIVVDCSIIAR